MNELAQLKSTLFEDQLACEMMATVSPVRPITMQLLCFLMMTAFESYSLTNLQVYALILIATAVTLHIPST